MQYEINKIKTDEYGRKSGILAINKPVDLTSHDVVAKVRKALNTRQVGHAGALDPFATGVLIVLVGKATKLSDTYLKYDKEYIATVLFGISTNSGDIEGEITAIQGDIDLSNLHTALSSFVPTYEQYVPVYSSVKVGGEKLRVLARSADRFEIEDRDNARFVKFFKGEHSHEIELPKHLCSIPYIELLEEKTEDISQTEFYKSNSTQIANSEHLPAVLHTALQAGRIAKIRIGCSKGTYIRTMAEDIGYRLTPSAPAMLLELIRTKVGEIDIADALELEQVGTAAS